MKRKITDAELDQLIKEAFEVTDDQLAEVLDCAKKEAELQGELFATPPQGGFEDVMRRVVADNKTEDAHKKTVRLKRIIRPMFVAAVLGTIILGTGISVSGRKGFAFESWNRSANVGGYDNSNTLNDAGTAAEAYKRIGDEIGIRTVELFYRPKGVEFNFLEIENGRAFMVFSCGEGYVHFLQALNSADNSTSIASDRTPYQKIEHRVFGNIDIYQNLLEDGTIEYSAQFAVDNAYYYLTAVMEESEFLEIVSQLKYYSPAE